MGKVIHTTCDTTRLTGKMLVTVFAAVIAVLVTTSGATLPQFSWDTLPVFFHSSNSSGPYSADAIRVISKYSMVTIEKWQGHDMKNVDDEDQMVLAMKAIKQANPKVATYFYMNSFKDRPEMTRMARELEQHQDWILHNDDGKPVKNSQGFLVFDQSNPDVRQWWLKTCLDAVSAADGDGCFCDSSQHTDSAFPNVSATKMQEWSKGLLTLTQDVQEKLGNDKLLIGKVPDQPYVKAVQIEAFQPNNRSINSLMEGVKNGKVIQAHMEKLPAGGCMGNITNHLAAFLIGAGNYSYYGCGSWNLPGNSNESWYWRPEFDYPLGEPVGPPLFDGELWQRRFVSETLVKFDITTNQGSIHWDYS